MAKGGGICAFQEKLHLLDAGKVKSEGVDDGVYSHHLGVAATRKPLREFPGEIDECGLALHAEQHGRPR